jgi:hypothetical protein
VVVHASDSHLELAQARQVSLEPLPIGGADAAL